MKKIADVRTATLPLSAAPEEERDHHPEYVPAAHTPRKADTEASRQRNAAQRRKDRKQARELKQFTAAKLEEWLENPAPTYYDQDSGTFAALYRPDTRH